MDFSQGFDVDMRVDLSRFEAFVTKHFLHVADVCTASVHVGRTGVAEEVAGASHVDAALFHEPFEPVADGPARHPLAVTAQEQGRFAGQMVKLGPCLLQVSIQPRGSSFTRRQEPGLAELSLADVERAGLRVVVIDVYPRHLKPSDSGGVEEFEHGSVPQAEGAADVRDGQKGADLFSGKATGKLSRGLARQIEVGGRVRRDDSIPAKPGEKSPHTPDARKLGGDGQRLTGGRAPMAVEETLVGLHVAAGDDCGRIERLRCGPLAKMPQCPAVGIDA